MINLILAGRKSRHGEDRFHKGSHRLDGLLWLSHDITVVARLDHLVLNVGFRLEGIGHLEDKRLIGRGTNVPEIERFSNVIVGVSPVDSGVVSSDTNLKMVWGLATNISVENSGWIQLTAPRLVSPQEMLTW